MAGVEPDILIIKTPTSVDSIGYFMEERGRTFVVSQAADDISGASEIELVIEDDVERIMRIVNEKFEAKESQIKDELRSEFEDRLRQIERSHELSLKHLKGELSTLSKVSLECEYLKTLQKELRTELDIQQEKIRRLTRENYRLKSNTSKSNTVTHDNERLKEENETLKEENQRREAEIDKLSRFITQKELEIATLKTQIDLQYKKIKLDLSNTRDKFRHDHTNLNAGMKKHELLLSEISEAVKHISKSANEVPKAANAVKVAKETITAKTYDFGTVKQLKDNEKRRRDIEKSHSDKRDSDKRDRITDTLGDSFKRDRYNDKRVNDADRGHIDYRAREDGRRDKDRQAKRPTQRKKQNLPDQPFK